MAKSKQTKQSKTSASNATQKVEKKLQFPHVGNLEKFLEFVSTFPEEQAKEIVSSIVVVTFGTACVAQVVSHAKGVKQNELAALPSVKFYNSKLVGGSDQSFNFRTAAAIFSQLEMFQSEGAILESFDKLVKGKAKGGSLIKKIELYPAQLSTHLGGVVLKLGGLWTSHPIFHVNSFGIKFNDISTIQEVIDLLTIRKDLLPTQAEIAQILYDLLATKQTKDGVTPRDTSLVFPDGITINNTQNLVKLEEHLNKEILDMKLTDKALITRPYPQAGNVTQVGDPNEAGLSPLEKFLRIEKSSKIKS